MLHHFRPYGVAVGEMPQTIFCAVLASLHQVNTVLLQVPVTRGDGQEYRALCTEIEAINMFHGGDGEGVASAVPFQHIHTLLLQGDPDGIGKDDEQAGHNYTLLLSRFPNLTTVKVTRDSDVWDHNALRPPFIPRLRHIHLYDSDAGPCDLGNLLDDAPMLETLHMTPAFRPSARYDPNLTFGIALTNHTNLRDLNVDWVRFDDRITSLSEVQSLHSLSIRMELLYGRAALKTPLVDLLPPNLVKLTVKAWRQRRVELCIFVRFARDVRKRLHSLKEVVLLYKRPWTWRQERVVKTMFLKRGVEFSAELDDG
jgi:hypothetical protein